LVVVGVVVVVLLTVLVESDEETGVGEKLGKDVFVSINDPDEADPSDVFVEFSVLISATCVVDVKFPKISAELVTWLICPEDVAFCENSSAVSLLVEFTKNASVPFRPWSDGGTEVLV
jgi:hypothetical protein